VIGHMLSSPPVYVIDIGSWEKRFILKKVSESRRRYKTVTVQMARKRKHQARKRKHHYSERQRCQMEEVMLAVVASNDQDWIPVFKYRGELHCAAFMGDMTFSTLFDASAFGDRYFRTIHDWARSLVAAKRGLAKKQVHLSLRSMLRFVPYDEDDRLPDESDWLTVDNVLSRIDRTWAEVIFPYFVGNIFSWCICAEVSRAGL